MTIWRPSTLSELTSYKRQMELSHLSSDAFILSLKLQILKCILKIENKPMHKKVYFEKRTSLNENFRPRRKKTKKTKIVSVKFSLRKTDIVPIKIIIISEQDETYVNSCFCHRHCISYIQIIQSFFLCFFLISFTIQDLSTFWRSARQTDITGKTQNQKKIFKIKVLK